MERVRITRVVRVETLTGARARLPWVVRITGPVATITVELETSDWWAHVTAARRAYRAATRAARV